MVGKGKEIMTQMFPYTKKEMKKPHQSQRKLHAFTRRWEKRKKI